MSFSDEEYEAMKQELEGQLETLRAEAVRLREALENLIKEYESVMLWEDRCGCTDFEQCEYHRAKDVLSSTPAPRREVERVRAMERVVEAALLARDGGFDETEEALAAYEQVVKKEPEPGSEQHGWDPTTRTFYAD